MSLPSNMYVEEIEFRYVRELDLFEVGCKNCGNKDTTMDRRWPEDSYVEYLVNKVCTCEEVS